MSTRIPALLLLALCLIGCARTLEANDVQNFHVTANPDMSKLQVSGLVFHSGLAVASLEERKKGSDLIIAVRLTPAREGLSGSFDYTIDLPPNTQQVLFGNRHAVIWTRP